MLYKKQLKRLTKKMIANHRKWRNIQPNEITPAIEKAKRKAEKMRINNGQTKINRLEAIYGKKQWIIVAVDFMRDECWVIKRKK